MMPIYKFIQPAFDMEPELDMGSYRIGAKPEVIQREADEFQEDKEPDEDFFDFIEYLKEKYFVEEYSEPHYIINY